jgi:microcystin degradation protein MlrC
LIASSLPLVATRIILARVIDNQTGFHHCVKPRHSPVTQEEKPVRIAIAGIGHETNTYCRDQTELSDFHISRGRKLFKSRGTTTSVGGALEACETLGVEAIPIMVAGTQPSGTINRDAYESMKAEILAGISQEAPLDGVYLELHGA